MFEGPHQAVCPVGNPDCFSGVSLGLSALGRSAVVVMTYKSVVREMECKFDIAWIF